MRLSQLTVVAACSRSWRWLWPCPLTAVKAEDAAPTACAVAANAVILVDA